MSTELRIRVMQPGVMHMAAGAPLGALTFVNTKLQKAKAVHHVQPLLDAGALVTLPLLAQVTFLLLYAPLNVRMSHLMDYAAHGACSHVHVALRPDVARNTEWAGLFEAGPDLRVPRLATACHAPGAAHEPGGLGHQPHAARGRCACGVCVGGGLGPGYPRREAATSGRMLFRPFGVPAASLW